MFAFAYIYMESVAACNVSVEDMLGDEEFKSIRVWDDYVQWKKLYYAGCRCVIRTRRTSRLYAMHASGFPVRFFQSVACIRREDGYSLSQLDLKKPLTRELEHWPKNAFVSAFAAAIGVDDSQSANLKDQVDSFVRLDWATVYYATEMFFLQTPLELIQKALSNRDPERAVKALFDEEFRLWQAFMERKGLKRLTDVTMPSFAGHAKSVFGEHAVIYARDDECIANLICGNSDRPHDDESAKKRKKAVKRGSASRPAKKAKNA